MLRARALNVARSTDVSMPADRARAWAASSKAPAVDAKPGFASQLSHAQVVRSISSRRSVMLIPCRCRAAPGGRPAHPARALRLAVASAPGAGPESQPQSRSTRTGAYTRRVAPRSDYAADD